MAQLNSNLLDSIGSYQGERMVASLRYNGQVNRKYEKCEFLYKVTPAGQRSYTQYSNKPIEAFRAANPGAAVERVR